MFFYYYSALFCVHTVTFFGFAGKVWENSFEWSWKREWLTDQCQRLTRINFKSHAPLGFIDLLGDTRLERFSLGKKTIKIPFGLRTEWNSKDWFSALGFAQYKTPYICYTEYYFLMFCHFLLPFRQFSLRNKLRIFLNIFIAWEIIYIWNLNKKKECNDWNNKMK